jgi:hypothetical protein
MAFAPLAGAALTAGGGGAAAMAGAAAAASTWATGAMVAATVLTGAMALGAMASSGGGDAPQSTEEPLDTTLGDDMELAKTRNTNLRRKLYGEERTNLLAEDTQGTTEKTTLGA